MVSIIQNTSKHFINAGMPFIWPGKNPNYSFPIPGIPIANGILTQANTHTDTKCPISEEPI